MDNSGFPKNCPGNNQPLCFNCLIPNGQDFPSSSKYSPLHCTNNIGRLHFQFPFNRFNISTLLLKDVFEKRAKFIKLSKELVNLDY